MLTLRNHSGGVRARGTSSASREASRPLRFATSRSRLGHSWSAEARRAGTRVRRALDAIGFGTTNGVDACPESSSQAKICVRARARGLAWPEHRLSRFRESVAEPGANDVAVAGAWESLVLSNRGFASSRCIRGADAIRSTGPAPRARAPSRAIPAFTRRVGPGRSIYARLAPPRAASPSSRDGPSSPSYVIYAGVVGT